MIRELGVWVEAIGFRDHSSGFKDRALGLRESRLWGVGLCV